MQIPFERIVQDHGLTVLRVCRALLDEHRAQDAWSETFLSALKAYPALPEDANVQAWLVTIAHRKAIDELRKNHPEVLTEMLPEAEVGRAGLPEARIMDRELWQALKALPPKQRFVLAYRYLGGLSYAQIAQVLSGSEAAARRAGSDGIKNLRAQWKHAQMLEELS